jgi:hypothetical protein
MMRAYEIIRRDAFQSSTLSGPWSSIVTRSIRRRQTSISAEVFPFAEIDATAALFPELLELEFLLG